MRSRWTALLVVLVLAGLAPRTGEAQSGPPQTPPRKAPTGGLGNNYPNPMNPETHIPFGIDCGSESGRKYVVTLRIFNALAQPIAIPQIQKDGRLLNRLEVSCGQYNAYWNGEVLGTRRKAPSGVYTYILEVDGHKFPPKKMMVAK